MGLPSLDSHSIADAATQPSPSAAPYWTLLGAVVAAVIAATTLLINESRKRRSEQSKELRALVRLASLRFLSLAHRAFRQKVELLDQGVLRKVDIQEVVEAWNEVQLTASLEVVRAARANLDAFLAIPYSINDQPIPIPEAQLAHYRRTRKLFIDAVREASGAGAIPFDSDQAVEPFLPIKHNQSPST